MNTKKLSIIALAILLGTTLSLSARAEEAKQPDMAQMMGMTPEDMAKMQEFSTPNENHKVLESFAGDWTYTIKMWMTPESPVQESTGTSQSKLIFGGRFLEQTAQGTSMGQPFEGKGIIGFDNVKKQYQSIWFDSMSTAMMISSSTYDAAKKTFTEEGTASCPFEGGDKKFHSTITIIDADTYVYSMNTVDKKSGKDYKMMEITYKKKK